MQWLLVVVGEETQSWILLLATIGDRAFPVAAARVWNCLHRLFPPSGAV